MSDLDAEVGRMDAYYYGFDETGVGAVDAILSAVAQAGKNWHHTDEWGSPHDWTDDTRSDAQRIQDAADQCAVRIAAHVAAERDVLLAKFEALVDQWPVGDNGQDYRAAVTQCAAAIRDLIKEARA